MFDDGAKERFVGNVSGHMANCRDKSIIARQLAIFHEASPDLAARVSKATGVSEYEKGIAGIRKLLIFHHSDSSLIMKPDFNGIRNGMHGVKWNDVNKNNYSNGYANGHPSENLANGESIAKV